MTPTTDFPQASHVFGPPKGMTDEQCRPIRAYCDSVKGGSLDGMSLIVTAWKPDEEELKRLQEGGSVYVSFIGCSLPPHYLCTSFAEAVSIA